DSSGRLMSYQDAGTVTIQGPYSETGNDGIIAWGRAVIDTGGESGLQPFHYALGTPVPNPNDISSKVATYSLISGGATKPTDSFSGLQASFSLVSADITANFSSGAVSGGLGWSNQLTAGFSGSIVDGGQKFSGSGLTSSSSGGTLNVDGFFAGTNAARAGLIYLLNDSEFGSYIGAAALAQTNLSDAELRLVITDGPQ
ncbi:MAG TPA: hypothetical protein VMP00_09710, partial [Burkholderiales bacterium]|nr:hypothetical protein [Burkholderiales bacterium]